MRRWSLRTKIFAAIVGVTAVSLTITAGFLFRHATRLVRSKTIDELSTASATVAHFVEHNLEDALRQLETCAAPGLQKRSDTETNPEQGTDVSLKPSFLAVSRHLFHTFPWIVATAYRDTNGQILLSHGDERLLATSLEACEPLALFPKGCFIRAFEQADAGKVYVELGLSRIEGGSPWTFVVDMSSLTETAPVPQRLFNDLVVVLGKLGRADTLVVKSASWADKKLQEDLAVRLGQIFLGARKPDPGSITVEAQEILVAFSHLPKVRWPLAMAVPSSHAGLPSSALLSGVAWACSLSVLLSLVVAWLAASRLMQPLRRLQEAFHEFSQGHWNVQVPVTSGDEIAELTDGFNQGVVFLNTQHRKLKRFQTVVHHAQDAVVLCSSKGSFVYANPSAYEFFGFQRREDIVLTRLHDRVCTVDRERFENTVWPLMLQGPWEGEVHFCRQDGKVQVGWLRAGVVPEGTGEPNFVYAIIRDITDRKATEEALRTAEEYYRTLFRTSRDAIVVTDPSEIIVDVNEPAFPCIFGYTRQEILGRSIIDLMAEESRASTAPFPEATKEADRVTVKWRRKDGSLFQGEATLSTLKNAKDHWLGYVRVIRDVSEREGFLEKLERAYQDLKSLDELKDKFLAGVSHDLRTPLIPVRAFLEKLLQGKWGPLTPRQEEFLRYCLIGVSREMILVDELLDYTRLKSGKLTLRQERVDLQEVLRTSLFLLKILAQTNRLTIAVDIPLEPVPILGDYNKLLRIFHNLFSNAVKYNRPGGHVTVRGTWEGLERFRVAVEDTGIGIPQEDLRRIFDDFYRVDASGSVVRGSGIGLAVVKELVHLHNAQLDVQSTLGVGSIFAITFPVLGDSQNDRNQTSS
ncbi:MAG: PAS domain S-box protein [Desulfosoma sp.]